MKQEHTIATQPEETDSLAWAKPYVDEALADVARGHVLTREEYRARNNTRLAAMVSSISA